MGLLNLVQQHHCTAPTLLTHLLAPLLPLLPLLPLPPLPLPSLEEACEYTSLCTVSVPERTTD
jgi:hypothetical protein